MRGERDLAVVCNSGLTQNKTFQRPYSFSPVRKFSADASTKTRP